MVTLKQSTIGCSRQHSFVVGLSAMVAMTTFVVALAKAGPVNPSVQRGNVTITQDGNNFVITASDGSIINYDAFGILNNESIQFIQPGDAARVLNRITGADPTLIEGTLHANGIVYIVNPAGVFFSQGSIVNVGGIYAAAGSITDEDYINFKFDGACARFEEGVTRNQSKTQQHRENRGFVTDENEPEFD